MTTIRNIVLVHGGFVDGSGWQGVHEHLTADGYRVAVVQNPTLSLAGDVAATHQILDGLDGPAVLVAPQRVRPCDRAVTLALELPDDSVPARRIGVATVDQHDGRLGARRRAAAGRGRGGLQATQRPFDADSFTYPTQAAAWRTIPSWGLVAGRDKAIPARGRTLDVQPCELPQGRRSADLVPRRDDQSPEGHRTADRGRRPSHQVTTAVPARARRAGTVFTSRLREKPTGSRVVEVAAGHAVNVSRFAEVAALIRQAAGI
ncbi:hypothetical protein AB0E10_38060 [Streptomyces sp. NPDC048045]|uniref:hypothetical protein n=1 Tax=Streptomyces sp. NPDC048045 TaxID=3154710 RepID=UPI003423734A